MCYEGTVAALPVWLNQNWFPLLQSVGIILGLLFTAITIRRDTKTRRTTDLLTLVEQHRQLWSELHRRPDLRRVRTKEVDLLSAPLTSAEEEFLNLVFVHFYTNWLMAKGGARSLVPIEAFAADVRGFFSLALPKAVWESTRDGRDPKFVQFVERCLV